MPIQVNLVMNSNNLQFTSQPLMGMQMGEYYGFSLLAVDLNGDKWALIIQCIIHIGTCLSIYALIHTFSFDEFLVGAPLFTANSTEPETGRVFVYRNSGVYSFSSHVSLSLSL